MFPNQLNKTNIDILNPYKLQFKFMSVSKPRQLDWLAFSKLTPNNAQNIFHLSSLLKNSTISQQMFNRLPKSYLNRFFSTVQEELINYNNNQPQFKYIVELKGKEREEVIHKMRGLENKIKNSKDELEEEKKELEELERVYERLKQKGSKVKKQKQRREKEKKLQKQLSKQQQKQKQKKQGSFYCPYCKIDGFTNKDHFQNHMLTQHPLKDQANSMKEVVLAFKQKEMALLELVLKNKQDIAQKNRMLNEQEWSLKTRQFQSAQQFGSHIQSNQSIKTLESKKDPNSQLQLASHTSYVWFQKQNNSKKINQHQHEQDNDHYHYQTNRSQYQKSHKFNTNRFQNSSRPFTKQKSYHEKEKVRFSDDNDYIPYEVQIVSPQIKSATLKEEFDLGMRLGLYTTQKQPLKRYTVQQECQNSLYQTKNLSKITSGYHVYCSGPLEDDESDSQASDYFNKKPKPKIIDEQIEIPRHLLEKYGIEQNTTKHQNQILNQNNYQHHSHDFNRSHHNRTHTIKTLSSPKSGDRNQKSGIASILFSVQDKDFSLSKDSGSINLSDLKYQDLLIKKQQERKILELQFIPEVNLTREVSNGFQKKIAHDLLLSEFYENQPIDTFCQLPMKKVSSYRSNKSNANGSLLLDQFISNKRQLSSQRRGSGSKSKSKTQLQSPKSKGSKTQQSKEKASIAYPPRQKIQKMEKASAISSQYLQIPFNKIQQPQINSIQNQIHNRFPQIQQSQVAYSQQTIRHNNDSQPPTQRLILQTLIDLALIRQQQLQHSIDNKL